MMQKSLRRHNASQVARRLLLALVLIFAPLLAISDGMPTTMTAADDAAQTNHDMPCHPAQAEQTQQDACPHCTGDGAASQCHCCSYAAPAGLGFQAGTLPDSYADGAPPRMTASDPLPESSGDRLYRPPIFHN
jgi:hypothetical protein